MMRQYFERYEVPIAVAIGGAIGSALRWAIASAIDNTDVPIATFLTNVLGSFALGVVLVLGERIGRRQGHHHEHQKLHLRLWRPFLATGVLGGFTTFSTFVVEINTTSTTMAAAYLVASLSLGVAAYMAGNELTRSAFGVAE